LNLLRFAPGEPGVCNLGDVPADPLILECINIDGGDPGKKNIITTATGLKFTVDNYYGALCSTATPAVITAEQVKTLSKPKEAKEARKTHHFRALSVGWLWEAVRVPESGAGNGTGIDEAVARSVAMKRGLMCMLECKLAPRRFLTGLLQEWT
jgi:hypothetical protein